MHGEGGMCGEMDNSRDYMSLQSWGHAWRLRSQVQDSVSRALWQKELITSLVLSPPGLESAAPTEEALRGSPRHPGHHMSSASSCPQYSKSG